MTNPKHTDTSRSGNLVERLRERTCVVFNSPGVHPDTECLEAADRIEALEAENERLREALRPFAFLEMEKDEGPADTPYVWEAIYRDRVQDWIAYEDIAAARKALGDTHD